MQTSLKGAVMATAIAGLFAAGTACQKSGNSTTSGEGEMMKEDTSSSAEMVKCKGINACKGKGQCGGANHSCSGKNECKGKGWIKVSADECDEKGGEVI